MSDISQWNFPGMKGSIMNPLNVEIPESVGQIPGAWEDIVNCFAGKEFLKASDPQLVKTPGVPIQMPVEEKTQTAAPTMPASLEAIPVVQQPADFVPTNKVVPPFKETPVATATAATPKVPPQVALFPIPQLVNEARSVEATHLDVMAFITSKEKFPGHFIAALSEYSSPDFLHVTSMEVRERLEAKDPSFALYYDQVSEICAQPQFLQELIKDLTTPATKQEATGVKNVNDAINRTRKRNLPNPRNHR